MEFFQILAFGLDGLGYLSEWDTYYWYLCRTPQHGQDILISTIPSQRSIRAPNRQAMRVQTVARTQATVLRSVRNGTLFAQTRTFTSSRRICTTSTTRPRLTQVSPFMKRWQAIRCQASTAAAVYDRALLWWLHLANQNLQFGATTRSRSIVARHDYPTTWSKRASATG